MAAVPDQSLLHLASCSSAANVIRETLRQLLRDEPVLEVHDALEVGPLSDVDAGAASRIAWWKQILGERAERSELAKLEDSKLWGEVRRARSDIVLWHGPHPGERLFLLRACWHLRDQAGRVQEVELPAPTLPQRPACYGAVAVAGVAATTRAWPKRARIADVAARARQWEAVRSRPGECIRVLDGDRIVELPLTAHDDQLVEACAKGWTSSMLAIGTVLADQPIADAVLAWRLRGLLGAGKLEGRGAVNWAGLPAELRPASDCVPVPRS